MFNLIVPPIIIVVAIALLIIFLARVVPKSEDEARKRQLKKGGSSKIDNKKVVMNNVVDASASIDINEKRVETAKVEQETEDLKDDLNDLDDPGVINKSVDSMTELKPRIEIKKKDKKASFRDFVEKFNPFKKKANKNSVVLAGINRVDGIKRVSPQENTIQENKENFSKMDKILLDGRGGAKKPDSSNKEESELVRQISVDPRNYESYRRLGDFYVENDRLSDARECYKYVLRLDPKHKRAQLAMKRLDRILG